MARTVVRRRDYSRRKAQGGVKFDLHTLLQAVEGLCVVRITFNSYVVVLEPELGEGPAAPGGGRSGGGGILARRRSFGNGGSWPSTAVGRAPSVAPGSIVFAQDQVLLQEPLRTRLGTELVS